MAWIEVGHPFSGDLLSEAPGGSITSNFKIYLKIYPPGNSHIPPWEKENHLQKCLGMGYVSSQEAI